MTNDVTPRVVTGYISPIKLDALIAIMNAQENYAKGMPETSCCGGGCGRKLTLEEIEVAAYYIWLETGADADYCWYEALRTNT
jgi:hypothetical protein